MRKELVIAIRATLVTLILTGLVYPLAVTGAAQVLFTGRASGSLLYDEKGTIVGSELLGQAFQCAATGVGQAGQPAAIRRPGHRAVRQTRWVVPAASDTNSRRRDDGLSSGA